jgi:hypothetical protein
MTKHPEIAAGDVLKAFAMDFEPSAGTLKRYLAQYPEHATALVDLSRELSREVEDETPSAADLALVTSRMSRLREDTVSLESLQAAPATQFIDAAEALSLPMPVGIAFRERRIDVASLPRSLLARLAGELRASIETLVSYLELAPQASPLRARKSNVKPTAPEKVSFEQILRDAGVDEQFISNLLRDE